MRINKFLATCGVASRRKCDSIILEKRVKVNGDVCCELGKNINVKKDVVLVDDNPCILNAQQKVYLKMNKPKGYICSANDEKGRKTVFDLIKNRKERLFTVGRLDYDTEGLLILTNDGDFAERVIHPSFEKEKKYVCVVEGNVRESELAVMRNGVVVDGERLPSCRITKVQQTEESSRLEIVIGEGKNRQIRNMIEAIGRRIFLLKRTQIGSVKLGGLSRGEVRDLNQNEITALLEG